ncbi:histidinol-phosphatase [Companilactobacillus tucceti DSM 20183]|uniref:Histidinol-phosphatase n=1 Tax=Companilactobacillus tucceti DSM 20183 TaxID=1423811 RepID=A0A0R1J929_9LACO|nr:histidinol-phosphatase HisJ [Companilactobacillus tucceti]KRK64961.1 histidinol-phosphatase [Companilactobacillus tucceti DSM 20183]
MLTDGHTHTEFCPHGSGEPVEKMIQRAIQLGFKKYCITEHAPIPKDFEKVYAGTPDGYETAGIAMDDLPNYFKETRRLQKKYQSDIKITIGFEVDYLEGFENWTKDFLDEYGPETQESILSVHFMKGTDNKEWCIDYDPENYQTGFADYLDDPQYIFQVYYDTVRKSVEADLGEYVPQRIGHMSLIRKFQDYFNLTEDYDEQTIQQISEILKIIKQQNRELDLNLAGLYKPLCNDYYPGKQITKMAQKLNIPIRFRNFCLTN